jgi:hypothetical protein
VARRVVALRAARLERLRGWPRRSLRGAEEVAKIAVARELLPLAREAHLLAATCTTSELADAHEAQAVALAGRIQKRNDVTARASA